MVDLATDGVDKGNAPHKCVCRHLSNSRVQGDSSGAPAVYSVLCPTLHAVSRCEDFNQRPAIAASAAVKMLSQTIQGLTSMVFYGPIV
jgi:hypothetical protein